MREVSERSDVESGLKCSESEADGSDLMRTLGSDLGVVDEAEDR